MPNRLSRISLSLSFAAGLAFGCQLGRLCVMLMLPKIIAQHIRKVTLLLAVVGVGVLCGLVVRTPFLAAIEHLTRDIRLAYLSPPREQNNDIVIVSINEQTLRAFPYRSPIHRGFLADLVEILSERQVRAVGFDILFDRPTEQALDERLKLNLLAAPMPVIIATGDSEGGLDEVQTAYQSTFVDGLGHGRAQVLGDPIDNVVRRQRPISSQNGQLSFAAAIASALGYPVPEGDLSIDYRVGPNYDTPIFPIYPAQTIALLPAEWLAGKIALVGAIIPNADRHVTPLSQRLGSEDTAGIIIQAQMLAQLISNEKLPVLSPLASGFLTVVAGLVAALIMLLPSLLRIKLVILAMMIVAFAVGAFFWFENGGDLVPILAPILAMICSAALIEVAEGRHARAQRRYIRSAFDHYLAPGVVEGLVRDPNSLRLGGERRTITLIFTDIGGFTALSEKLPPDQMSGLLNDYLDQAMQLILDHGGTIDKIVGDAIHAFFGAPVDQMDHQKRCIDCAIAIDRCSEAYRAKLKIEGINWGETRIGVHTGSAIVGNFGGKQRFDYTAYGDVVNTVARLESINKQLGTRICVAEATVEGCNGYAFRPVGTLLLVGKSAALTTFEPILDEAYDLEAYLRAYGMLSKDQIEAATSAFERLDERFPADPLVKLHLGRLRRGICSAQISFESK